MNDANFFFLKVHPLHKDVCVKIMRMVVIETLRNVFLGLLIVLVASHLLEVAFPNEDVVQPPVKEESDDKMLFDLLSSS